MHLKDEVATYAVTELAGGLADCRILLKIDGGTGNQVVESRCDGMVSFDGYGVAVVTNAASRTDDAGHIIALGNSYAARLQKLMAIVES